MRRNIGWLGAVSILAFSLWALGTPSTAAAQEGEGYKAPFVETGLGATNIEATVGNGRLTAGISKDGDLSVLSWPSPSYWDQLHYITTNAKDARTQPRMGAPKRAGAFAGLVLIDPTALKPIVTYFRDWDRQVTYMEDDVSVVETTFTNTDLGLEVVQRDLIPSDRDVLVRQYLVDRKEATTDYEDIYLLGYSNLSPGLSKLPQIPLLDVLMDHQNDFLGIWHDDEDAIVQFHPEDTGIVDSVLEAQNIASEGIDREFGPIGDELTSESLEGPRLQELAGTLDDEYAEGVYAAMGTTPSPEDYQIGADQTDFCAKLGEIADNIKALGEAGEDLPASPDVADMVRCGDFDPLETPYEQEGWKYDPTGAFDDAKDGTLEGSPVAGAQVNTAMRVPLEFEGDTAQASLYYAFGSSSTEALDTLNWARDTQTTAILQDRVSHDQSYVDELWIPEEIEGDLRKFVKRAFLNLRVGTDDDTGAAVASISRQPSYQLDWPRDGAFFNTALDLAGQHDLVTKRMEFYSDTIRDEKKAPVPFVNPNAPGWPSKPTEKFYPPDSWEMNYYADGMVGGNIRLEIDNTALLVWAYVAHVGHLPEGERADYIDQAWPTIERAANFVADWRDPDTGLMWPANEDDNAEFTQGFQGAATSYLALVSAARLAKHRGEDELADKWAHRAGELHAATMHYMGDEEHGFIDYEEDKPAAGRAWIGWPTHFLPADNPRVQKILDGKLDRTLEKVRGEDGNSLYPTKIAISAAVTYAGNDAKKEQRQQAYEIAKRLAEDIANQNTYTIGEVIVPHDTDGDGETDDFINAVSTPHLWSAILVYITAVAYHHPDRFDPYMDVLPEVEIPEVTPPGVEGGGDAGMGDAGDAGTGDVATGDDAGGTDVAGDGDDEPPSDEGCSCAQSGDGGPAGTMLAVLLVGVVALRRRQR